MSGRSGARTPGRGDTAGAGGRAETPGPESVSRWKRWLPPLLAVPFLALLAFGLTRDAFVLPSPLPGRAAPTFELRTMDGDSVGLSDFRGRVLILNFWASWCPPCIQEHPVLVRANRTWDPEDVVVLGVLYQDTPENGRRFIRRWGGDWPTAVDPGSQTAIDYGVYGPPETFFIGPDGRVARKRIGPVSWELVKGTVDSLVAAAGAAVTRGGEGSP